MKKFRLLAWNTGFLSVSFLKEIRKHDLYGLKNTREVTRMLLDDEKPFMIVEDDKAALLAEIIERNHIVYEIEDV